MQPTLAQRNGGIMRKKISLGAALTFMAITAAVTFSITMVVSMTNFNSMVYNLKERESMYEKLSELEKLERQNFVGEIDDTKLQDSLARGFVVGTGDTYGNYYTAEQYKALIDTYSGKTVGIGAKVEKDPSGYILVSEIYADSPAQAAGMMVGDLIIKVDDLDITPDTVEEAGTKVNLVVRRETEDVEIDDVSRRIIDIPTVYYKMIDTNAYIRIVEFNDNTADQFEKAVSDAIAQNATGLIFDLRGNGGGTLDSAVRMLDKLLPEGTIVSATYKNGDTVVVAKSDSKAIDLPMMVLTNGDTASASELFTQALRDFGKAKSVGTRTFGKGTMQKTIKLNDGSAVDITVAKYNPPKSPNFDGIGIQPDFEVKLAADMEKGIKSMSIEAVAPENDAQLKKAIDVIEAAKKNIAEKIANESGEAESSSEVSSNAK